MFIHPVDSVPTQPIRSKEQSPAIADKFPVGDNRHKFDRASFKLNTMQVGDDKMKEHMKKAAEEFEKATLNMDEWIKSKGNLADLPLSPTFRVQTRYITTNKRIDSATDEERPGRFFINCTDFFDEAAKLYKQDKNFLDKMKEHGFTRILNAMQRTAHSFSEAIQAILPNWKSK